MTGVLCTVYGAQVYLLVIMLKRMSHPQNFLSKMHKLQKTRGPGALYRAQEYHCNLVLFFF